jgi:hypothetical protein
VFPGPGPAPSLDGSGIVFGRVEQGLDVVSLIAAAPTYLPPKRVRVMNDLASSIKDDRAKGVRPPPTSPYLPLHPPTSPYLPLPPPTSPYLPLPPPPSGCELCRQARRQPEGRPRQGGTRGGYEINYGN